MVTRASKNAFRPGNWQRNNGKHFQSHDQARLEYVNLAEIKRPSRDFNNGITHMSQASVFVDMQ